MAVHQRMDEARPVVWYDMVWKGRQGVLALDTIVYSSFQRQVIRTHSNSVYLVVCLLVTATETK